jgi:sigma-B regulation protein RsbU (phosphoserine phosphatase)
MDMKDRSYVLLKNFMDNVPDNIYFKDLESRFIMMNKSAAEWQGYPNPEEAVGKTDFDKYKEEDAKRMFESEQRIIETGEGLEARDEKETWRDGQTAWVSTSKVPLRDREGRIIGTFGISRDISEQKEAELRAERYADEMRAIKERLEEDLRMAAGLQKTFFPHNYPVFPEGATPENRSVDFRHYVNASGMVSGDFCTIRRLSHTEVGIFQCDVMGHGVRAAFGTALICALVEEVASQERDPAAFLARMNQLLLPILRQEDMFLYATACYVVFNAATGCLQMANAGHPSPLLLKESGHQAQWLKDEAGNARGPALAIDEEASYRSVQQVLEPGDAVIMYTDGLYEVSQADGEEFGKERLQEAAHNLCGGSLESIISGLVGAGRLFAGDEDFDDDVCLVGFKFRSPLGGGN